MMHSPHICHEETIPEIVQLICVLFMGNSLVLLFLAGYFATYAGLQPKTNSLACPPMDVNITTININN